MDHLEQSVPSQHNDLETTEPKAEVEPFPTIEADDTSFARKKRERDFLLSLAALLPNFAVFMASGVGLPIGIFGGALRMLKKVYRHHGGEHMRHDKHVFKDPLGYTYTPLYYSAEGKGPEKGDQANGLIIQMPRMSQDNILGESRLASLERELSYHIIKDIQERLKVSPHIEWVFLDARDFEKESIPQHVQRHPSRLLYDSLLDQSGYRLRRYGIPENEDRKLIPLQTEEFIDLTLDSADLLDQFIDAIDDEELTGLYEQALMADSGGRKRLHDELIILVTRLLNAEVRYKLDTDNYLSEPQSDKSLPRHTKLSQFVTIRRADHGFDVVRSAPRIAHTRKTSMNSELQDLRGGIRAGKVEIQLDDILRTSDTPVRDILEHQSPFQRAQLLYLCDSILRTADIDELFTIHRPVEDVLTDFHEQSVYVQASDLPKVFPTDYQFTKSGIKALISFTLIAGFDEMGSVISERSELLKEMPRKPVIQESSAFPDTLNPHVPSWKIETSDPSQSLDGYWVEQTFDTFRPEKTSWISHAQAHEVDFPSVPPRTYIKLSRPLMFHQATTIPVKQGTRLSAISGHTAGGVEVDIVTKVFTDGTVTAEYSGLPEPWLPTAIQLDVYLEPISTPDVVPLKILPMNQKVNIQEAGTTISDLYAEARMHTHQGHFKDIDEALAYLIRERHSYGIDPASKKLAQVHSLEEFVSEANTLKEMHCNTANSMLALLSQDPDRVYVTGFAGAYVQKQDPSQGYLLESSMHGFTIDENGTIQDATPPYRDGDAKRLDPDIESINQEWNKINEVVPEKVFDETQIETFSKMGKIAGSAIGLSLFARLSLRIKREAAEARRKPEVQQALDDEFLSAFHPDQVAHAVDFLLHVSHHSEENQYQERSIDKIVQRDKPMDFLMKNCVIDRIQKYLASPGSFEPDSWIKSQKKTTRAIAGYVLNVHEIFSALRK